jgi:hypothetical protein
LEAQGWFVGTWHPTNRAIKHNSRYDAKSEQHHSAGSSPKEMPRGIPWQKRKLRVISLSVQWHPMHFHIIINRMAACKRRTRCRVIVHHEEEPKPRHHLNSSSDSAKQKQNVPWLSRIHIQIHCRLFLSLIKESQSAEFAIRSGFRKTSTRR